MRLFSLPYLTSVRRFSYPFNCGILFSKMASLTRWLALWVLIPARLPNSVVTNSNVPGSFLFGLLESEYQQADSTTKQFFMDPVLGQCKVKASPCLVITSLKKRLYLLINFAGCSSGLIFNGFFLCNTVYIYSKYSLTNMCYIFRQNLNLLETWYQNKVKRDKFILINCYKFSITPCFTF